MIEYKIKHPIFLLTALKSITGCKTDEMLLQFGGRLRSYGMDGSRVSLYEIMIGPSQLEIIQDGKIDIILHVPSLAAILNRFKNPDELTIIYDQNRVKIKGKIDNRTKTFTLASLDGKKPKDPSEALDKLQLNSVFNINLSEFLDMIEDVLIYSDSFNLSTEDTNVIVEAFGSFGNAIVKYDLGTECLTKERCNYSLMFMKNILKALGNQDVTICFGHDLPMLVYSKLADDSYVKWYLAPRVEQDDDLGDE